MTIEKIRKYMPQYLYGYWASIKVYSVCKLKHDKLQSAWEKGLLKNDLESRAELQLLKFKCGI